MVQLGVEQFLEDVAGFGLRQANVGLVTNYGNADGRLTPVIDRFLSADVRLVKLFGPEHGVKNAAKEGEPVFYEVDAHSQVPAYSLYGDQKKPTAQMLSGLDALIIDLQDIGTRYYTNVSTMLYCMKACAEVGLTCVVLDRPNPIGDRREGYPLQPDHASFVGMLPIPNRHGCTIGELARFIQATLALSVDLRVVPMTGWKREMLLPDTGLPFTPPSPNTTGMAMMLLYPGTCLFEGTNVSVGRGTTHPFEVIGAPWLDGHRLAQAINDTAWPGAQGPSVVARPVYFNPFYSQYAGELCSGVQLHIVDARTWHALGFGIRLLAWIRDGHPNQFQFTMPPDPERSRPFFDLLAGDSTLRMSILQGTSARYLDGEPEALAAFAKAMDPFLLYR